MTKEHEMTYYVHDTLFNLLPYTQLDVKGVTSRSIVEDNIISLTYEGVDYTITIKQEDYYRRNV